MDLLGKTLGNYRIDRLLGEGGMGAVYQAYDLALQREVAIKLIHPHFARRDDFRERFLQEARIMARLDHPGIVKVYLLGKEKDLLYLPMEFIRGGNLRQLLDRLMDERKWLPLNEATLLMKQLCETVDYAHEHGVLHRDIKPANLMLKPERTEGLPFRVVLTDLGLAKLLQGLGMTQEGTYLGTPAYMSPEQASGRSTDARSDVYSLGILLYELAVGRLPFRIRSAPEAMRYHTQEPPPPPRSIRAELPENLERVILKALEKDPHQRYASAAAMGIALAEIKAATSKTPEVVTQHDHSLSTVYDQSLVAEPTPQAASLMTMIDDGTAPQRGESVFGIQSIPPSAETRIQAVYKGKTEGMFSISSGTIHIGRDSQNDIKLSDPKASKRHAQISYDGMEYHVMDLSSSNGTYLGHTKLLPGISEVWRRNQSLRIGDTWLRLIGPTRGLETGSVLRSRLASVFTSSGAGVVGVSVNPQQPTLEPGESLTMSLALLNQSAHVDHFSISLSGIPKDWIGALPSSVRLMPDEQKEVSFSLYVPRIHSSRAGQHPMTLRVISETDSSEFVEVRLNLKVGVFSEFRAELQTQRLRAGQPGRLIVSNLGNAPEKLNIQFSDADGELTLAPAQPEVQVGPGETALVLFQGKENQPRWIGAEKALPFAAKVSLAEGDAQTLRGEFLSRGSIPMWALPTMLLLCLFAAGAAIAISLINRTVTLTVLRNGEGVVTSSPVGIDCGLTCSYKFRGSQAITLVAAPVSPSTFGGWSGAGCSGASPMCDVKISGDQTITAIFNPPGSQTLIVNKSGNGTGTVISSPIGIDCGPTCTYAFAENTTLTLTANPISPSTFGGWSGACSGTASCTVTMSEVQSVGASFNLPGKQTLTISKNGAGTVTSSPTGIDCGSTCAFDFPEGTSVTLTAAASTPSTFGGWSGACTGTSPTCTVTMNAAQTITVTFNSPANQTLTVNKSGTGSGTITSSPAGIDCGATCSFDFANNAPVTLLANPISPSTFGGWSGACTGTSLTCTVNMNAAQTVTATFNPPGTQRLTINKGGTGSGTITSLPAGINCGSTCTFDFPLNTAVTLTATPTQPSTFGGWSGGNCSGTSLTCVVTMNAAQNVTAIFNPPVQQTLSVSVTGAGTVTSDPPGINCGSDCSESYPANTSVTLTANPTSPSTFAGWSGACSGTSPTCSVTLTQALSVIATFTPPPPQPLTVTKSGTGTGMITSSPPGINCGSDCSEAYPFNSSVTLTAVIDVNSIFSGWSGGGCSGTALTCVVTMSQAQNVSATFTIVPVLSAPTQISPADGIVFDHFPRITTLVWSAVPGAVKYRIERDFVNPGQSCPQGDPQYDTVEVTETTFTFEFVGAQPGCWRVWAVDAASREGTKSVWWTFRYTR